MSTRVRPQPTEFAEYYGRYIARVPDGDIVATMRSQGAEVIPFLAGVDAKRTTFRYAPGKWSLHEVVGHVVDMEWVFTVRALSFARGLKEPMPGVDENEFVPLAKFDEQSWPALLEQWRALRVANTSLFGTFDDDAWVRTGIASGYPVSVRALAYIVAGHAEHHMGVIRERYLSG